MKKAIKTVLLFCSTSFICLLNAQVKIGNNPSQIGESSLLELESNNKALLLTRVNGETPISQPVDGMILYDTAARCFKGYSQGAWFSLSPCTGPITVNNNITFNQVVAYNGPSPITTDGKGVGFYQEPVSPSSTIVINVTSTQTGPYQFSATDAASGLTYTAQGVAMTGTFNVTLTPNTVRPNTHGTVNMTLTGASNTLALSPRIDIKSLPADSTEVVDIVGPDGNTWMDRNLGAHQPADSIADPRAYGSLFQWSRRADGHEILVIDGNDPTNVVALNPVTQTRADYPMHDSFISNSATSGDWRVNSVDTLWAGVNAVNNPCPSGYRLPTELEWATWVSAAGVGNMADAALSSLKLPGVGFRANHYANPANIGIVFNSGVRGWYHSGDAATTSSNNTRPLSLTEVQAFVRDISRAVGFSVRCIKN